MYRTLLGIVAALGLALLVVGLSFSTSVDKPADFVFVNGSEPASLDPNLITDQVSGRIVPELFEGLTRWEAASLTPAPGVAERWEVSEDQKRYRFFLRKDSVWTDGTPITARDFIYSWKRLLEPELGAEYAYLLHMVRFAEAYNTYDGLADLLEGKITTELSKLESEHAPPIDATLWQRFIVEHQVDSAFKHAGDPRITSLLYDRTTPLARADLDYFRGAIKTTASWLKAQANEARAHFGVDGGVFSEGDYTLVVELNAATPYFLDVTSFYPTLPVPRHVVEAHPSDWFLPATLVSNGPFRLQSWKVNDRIRMVRSETYWGKDAVKLQVIDALPTENTTTALNLYLTGAADWVPDWYPKDLAPKLRTRPDFYANPGMVVYFYRLNTTRPPLNDARVRKAFNLAIDRQLITDKVLGLGQVPAYTFVPPGLPGYEPPKSAIHFDVAEARKLLAEAGYPEGRGFPRIGLIYNTNDMHKKLAEVVADQLRRNLGVEIAPYNQEWQSFLVTLRGKDYDMARSAWNGDYLDANTFLDMWVTNGANNQTGFSSPRYDALIRAATDVDGYLANPPAVIALKEPERIEALKPRALSAASLNERVQAKQAIRLELLREAEAILVEDEFPIIPVYFYVVSGLIAPKLNGFYSSLELPGGKAAPNLLDLHPFRELSLRTNAAGAAQGGE